MLAIDQMTGIRRVVVVGGVTIKMTEAALGTSRRRRKKVTSRRKSLSVKGFRGPATGVPAKGLLDPKLRGGVTIGPGW